MLVHFMSSSVLHPEENKRVAPVELCPILKTLYKILTRRELPTHGILQALRDEMMNDPRDRKEMLSWLKRIQLAGLDLYIYRRAGDRKLSSCLQTMDSLQILQVISFGLLVSIFARLSGNSEDVKLDYALFTANDTVVQDGKLGYTNLFDAMVDAVYSALEKAGRSGVEVVVSETGWPSGGNGIGATEENARLYNNNLVAHLNKNVGTPKRPGKAIETYLFAMFNENQKPAGTEQNFGLYHPDMTEVYHVNFSP